MSFNNDLDDIFLFPILFIIKNNKILQNKHMRRTIRLTESDLHRIVMESVNAIMNEGLFSNFFGGKKKTEQKPRVDYWANRGKERQQAEKEKRDKEYYRRSAEIDNEYVRNRRAREGSNRNQSAAHAGETYYGIGHSAYDDMGR